MQLFSALKLYYVFIKPLIRFSDTFEASLGHCFGSWADSLMHPVVTTSGEGLI